MRERDNEDKALAYDLLVGELRKLVKKWENEADTIERSLERPYRCALGNCADELLAVVDDFEAEDDFYEA